MNTIALQQLHDIPKAQKQQTLQAVWAASQDHDEPVGRPAHGWWSISQWATARHILRVQDKIIGFAAIAYTPDDEAAEARIGLLPAYRSQLRTEHLIRAVVRLVRDAGAPQVRLYLPSAATWASEQAQVWGFRTIRTQYIMSLPIQTTPQMVPQVQGVTIRPLHSGEEEALLEALNRAWAETWNFRPLTRQALANDLNTHQDGMFVATDARSTNLIVGTVHAMFDSVQHNPDGTPYAWLSNLTTDPMWRGKGLGRALLITGIRYLYQRGAHSVTLGVDGGAIAPVALYTSVGFRIISTVQIWEHPIVPPTTP